MMYEIPVTLRSLVWSLLLGAGLGTFFFGGLWWTVKRAVSSTRAGLWFSVSLLVRISVVLVGFYFFGSGNWQQMLACLMGFIIARIVILRMTAQAKELHGH